MADRTFRCSKSGHIGEITQISNKSVFLIYSPDVTNVCDAIDSSLRGEGRCKWSTVVKLCSS